MNGNATAPSMNQKIFSMDLDVETVSLYLLCCALADTGQEITLSMLREKWNGDQSSLEMELERLEKKNIIRLVASEAGSDRVYRLVHEKYWQ